MKRRNVIVAIGSAALALVASVFAAQSVKTERDAGRCYPTDDGKFVCKETGKVMTEPCCEQPGEESCQQPCCK